MFRSHNVLAPLFAFGLLLDFSTAIALAQSAPPQESSKPAQTSPAETLHTGTELVVVDVIVQGRSGQEVHGLKQNDFVLMEQKKPQAIRNFEEHSATTAQKPGPPLPPMPPGVFTDYTPVAPGSTLNVLLIDTLNTPMSDQNFLRKQLLDFAKHEKPGTQVAVFVLTSRVFMLQGFSSDPAVLRTVLDNKLIARGSPLLNDVVGTGTGPDSLPQAMQGLGGGDAEIAQALQQAEQDMKAFQTKTRTQYTLDAFNSIGHYLSNFPGRKNILWFSGSFPLSIMPDPALEDPFSVMENSNEEFRETTNLLTRAQVAVYPIDARGLMIAPMFQASNSNGAMLRDPRASSQELMKFDESQAQEHMTMEQMASDTGGQAFFNTNGLSSAVARAMDAGSNYYTLAYTPTNRDWNGSYRNIHIALAGAWAAQGYKLSYRHGYYANDPNNLPKHGELPTQTAPSAAALADHASEAYSRAAISHGAPAPEDILFKVRAIPLTGKDEDTVAAGNQADPAGKMKAPYRTYAIDYVALPSEFKMALESDGRHKGVIEFTTFVFDSDGNVLNIANKEVSMELSPETYRQFMSTPVRFQLQVSAPVKQESYMRLMIRDVPNNRYGVVEIPTAEVRRLSPLEAQADPTGAKPPTAAAPAQPAAKQ
jgi:VWFA-related protein